MYSTVRHSSKRSKASALMNRLVVDLHPQQQQRKVRKFKAVNPCYSNVYAIQARTKLNQERSPNTTYILDQKLDTTTPLSLVWVRKRFFLCSRCSPSLSNNIVKHTQWWITPLRGEHHQNHRQRQLPLVVRIDYCNNKVTITTAYLAAAVYQRYRHWVVCQH